MRHLLLGSASALSLALYPLSVSAQTDVWERPGFDRYDTRVNTASAYTAVLLEAHGHVRNFINGTAQAIKNGARAGDTAAQQAYVSAIARAIEQTGQPPAQGSVNELPDYPYAQMATFNVAFRYCGGRLTAFFDTNTYKSTLTPEQIQVAPRLQAIREGKWGANRSLRRAQTAADGTRFLITDDNQQVGYDACIDELNGTVQPLADNTLLVSSPAAVPFEMAQTRVIRVEHEMRPCDAGYVGSGKRFVRDWVQPLDAAGKRMGPLYPEAWRAQGSFCAPAKLWKRFRLMQCSDGSGIARYHYWLLETQDPSDRLSTIMVPSDVNKNPTVGLQLTRDVGTCFDEYPNDVTIPPVSDTTTRETRARACSAVYPGWSNLAGAHSEARTRRERAFQIAQHEGLPDIRQVIYSDWAATSDSCRRITYSSRTQYRNRSCSTGYTGSWRQRRTFRTTHTNYANPSFTDTSVERLYSGWTNVTYTCRLIPPPPPAPPSWVGGGSGGPAGSVDVNGDGIGDYGSMGEASAAGHSNGVSVDTNCGSCNGPTGGDGGDGGGGKIICTAMNSAYGFGSYRQAIWLAHAAQNMTPYHQTGYHLLALPLIRAAYGSDTRKARLVRASIEHMARERTADIRAEMRGSKRRALGRMYRAILEPLCYVRGWAAGGRSVDAIKEVPVIAAALRARTPNTKGQIHV